MNTRLSVSLGFVLLALASVTLTGCPQGSDLEDEDRFTGAGGSAGSGSGGSANDCLQCDVQAIIKSSCLGVGCHGSSNFAGSLDLESPNAESRLLNVPAWAARADEVSDADACDLTEMRVDGNDPSKSALLEKLQGTHSCGLKMPVAAKLPGDPNAAIECFRRWSYCMAGKDPDGASGSGGTGSGGTAGTGGTGSGGTSSGGTSSGGTAGSGGSGSGGTAGTGGSGSGGTGGSGGSAGGAGGSGGSGGSAP